MSRHIHVALLPELVDPELLVRSTAVVMDVLRASTTIATALCHGAAEVCPFGDVESARRYAATLPAGSFVLGGERGGVRIAGFDLDNSPTAYTESAVRGKKVLFTTTNGTRALLTVDRAPRVLVAAFVNLQATVDDLLAEAGNVVLVCAGTDGAVSMEDVLCAGAFVHHLETAAAANSNAATQSGGDVLIDDSGRLAADAYVKYCVDSAAFLQSLRRSQGGSNLVELGLADDIAVAANLNSCPVVAEFDAGSNRILAKTVDSPR